MQHPRGIIAVMFSRDSRLLAAACAGGEVRIWERATGRLVCPSLGHVPGLWRIAFSPDDNWLLVSRDDKLTRVIAAGADSRPVTPLEDIAQLAAGMRIDEDGGVDPLSSDAIYARFQNS